MKTGDVVNFTDYSWQLTVIEDRLEHRSEESKGENLVVVAVNCVLPTHSHFALPDHSNNAIVRGKISGRLIFTQERFLRLAIREVTMAEVCDRFGETVKIIK